MKPSVDYQDASPRVCRRCGVRGDGPHDTPDACIEALRTIIAKMEFRQDQVKEKQPAGARGGRRDRSDNRMVLLDGERVCLAVAARRLGISTSALHHRIIWRTGTAEYAEVDIRAISADVVRTPDQHRAGAVQ